MRKRQRRLLSLLVASSLLWGTSVPFAVSVAEAAVPSSMSVIWQTPIGEGVTLYKYSKAYGNQQSIIYVTQVDLNNDYVEVKPVYGTNGLLTEKQTVTKMANETGAIAAINADFFNMQKRGAPFGVVVKDSDVVSSMGHISYWYSLGITDDKLAYIEHLGFTGKVTAENGTSFSLRGVNKEEYNPSEGKSHLGQLNLYTPKFGKTSLGPISGYKNVVEVVFVNGVATEVRTDQPAATIPANGFVLWGQGAAADFLKQNVPVGSTVNIDSQTTPNSKNWIDAVGGGVLLVDQGKPLTSFRAEAAITGKNAHTAVGVSQDGKMLYIVANDDTANSRGLTLQELSQVMVDLGAYRAVNFDGGGSTTISARMLGDTQAKLINQPKGGAERRVPTGLAVYNTAPQGTLSNFQIDGPTDVLMGQTADFTTKAYDNHYLPYKIDPSDITWTVRQSEAGTFEGHQLTALKPGTITIEATAAGISKTRDVRVLSGQDIAQVIVSPGTINIAPGQTVTLDVKVKTKQGVTVQATPLSVKVTSNSSLLNVNDKLQLTANDGVGQGSVTVSYDGVSTTVPVNIGEQEQPWLNFDNLTGLYHAGYPEGLNNAGSFSLVSDPVYRSKKAAKLTYNFAGASEDDVRIAYGRMGSNAVAMPGQPIGMGLWVYGDNSSHWLRAEIMDAKGKQHLVDLAEKIDWTGWKQVKGYFPANVSYPVSLRSIYVVDKPEESETRPLQGTVYFDEASVLLPFQAGKQLPGADVDPAKPGKLSLGDELDLSFSFARSADYLSKARIDVKSSAGTQLPGYVASANGFTISPIDLKPGKTDQFSTSPATITLKPKKWTKRKGVGLLYVNEANQTFDPLVGQMDPNGNWVYQVNSYGTYIPYYLDIPDSVPFMDILNHLAQEEITKMAAKGYIKGLAPDVFGPEVSLTRAEFVTLLSRVYNWKLPAKPKLSFKDPVPDWAQGAVQVALANGIVKGYEDKTFRANQPVTRAEAAVILDRLMKKQKKPEKAPADQKSWPSWAASSINNVVGLGLMDPIGDNFAPNQPTTRAEYVVALYRMLGMK
ncbi:phosphodiester glycosidase family protein [Brevibacillus sp. B_LB10_24]|uniref:phosphodiester glycosidase family protein n=1 Tax=Brevibacillus sp. B_LB10_24 TaxID=3380645 RepID=UPI0038B76146